MDERKAGPDAAPAQNQRGYPALLTAPGRSPNSPSEKTTRLGLSTVERNPPEAVAVLGWL